MHQRTPLTAETLAAVTEQLAGLPRDRSRTLDHVKDMEELMAGVDRLRKLPLKDIPPPLAFSPEAY